MLVERMIKDAWMGGRWDDGAARRAGAEKNSQDGVEPRRVFGVQNVYAMPPLGHHEPCDGAFVRRGEHLMETTCVRRAL